MKDSIFAYRNILFISLCVSISIFLGDRNINWALVSVIALSPVSLLFSKIKTVDKSDFLMLLVLGFMLVNGFIHGGFRLSSYIFSVCFVTSFVYLKGAVKKGFFSPDKISELLKFLIFLYTVILVIQQLCVIIGVTPFLASNYDENFKWKLSSLSPEPSHFAVFIFFMMYAHILLYEIKKGKRYKLGDISNEKFLWLAYFYCMLGSGSTSGVIYVLLIFFRFVRGKTILLYTGIFAVVFFVVNRYFTETQSLVRVDSLWKALLTLDGEAILNADHSAAMRLSPMIYFFNNIEFGNIDFWFGHGMDYGKRVFNIYMFDVSGDGTYNEFEGVYMGGFWGFILDYGFISFCLLVAALVSLFKNIRDKWYMLFYAVLMMFTGFNMQMFWFATILSYTVAFYNMRCNTVTSMHIRRNRQPLTIIQ